MLGKLVDLYGRMIADGVITDPSLVDRAIHLVVVLSADGRAVDIESHFREEGKIIRGSRFMAPHPPKGRTGTKAEACLLYDKVEYALGLPSKCPPTNPSYKSKLAKAAAAQTRFCKTISDLPQPLRADAGVAAALAFANNPSLGTLGDHPGLKKVLNIDGGQITFRLEDDVDNDGRPLLVFERPAVRQYCQDLFQAESHDAPNDVVCSVTGARGPIARLHTKIKGISDSSGKRAEATLVSYNQNAFESWGLDKGENAAVSEIAERAYTSALNKLISDNHSRPPVGGVTYVTWPDGLPSPEIDEGLASLFGDYSSKAEDASGDIAATLRAAQSGLRPYLGEGTYNVLGLQAVMGRAVVRFWKTATVEELGAKMSLHFDDFGAATERRVIPIWLMLRCVVADSEDAPKPPPALAEGIMQAALNGTPYPAPLLWGSQDRYLRSRPGSSGAILNTNRNRVRCIIACLQRSARVGFIKEGVPMTLEKNNPNVAYQLGRLFATYENIQYQSDPKVSVTIRDSMFGSAARTPARVFSVISVRSAHHLAKIRKTRPGLAYNLSEELGTIVSMIPASGPPDRLPPEEAARFVVGYHHQRAERFSNAAKASAVPAATN